MSSPLTAAPIIAAGVLCWRIVDGEARVLIVRRTQYKDVSIPKGKLDPGETPPETAVRELLEETGVSATIASPFSDVRYLAGGKPKVVHYWSAEIVDDAAADVSGFVANDEIAAVEWMPLAEARKKATYPHDAEMLFELKRRIDAGIARTFAIIIARHGKALSPSSWDGPDATRPLLHRGVQQAEAIAPAIAAYGPQRIISSTAVRCRETVAPLSALTGVPVREIDGISQDAYGTAAATVEKVIAKRLRRGQTAVLCSHGPVIPELLRAIAIATTGGSTQALSQAAALNPGDFAVIHIAPGARPKLVAIELPSPTL